MLNVEARHLELIQAIYEEHSITGASARLHLTQSALSHQLSHLEDRLGARLFERNGRTMKITSAGERLLKSARAVLPELRAAEMEISALSRSPHGVVRLATECYTCYWWLPGVLQAFSREFPRVEVNIELEATRRPIDALLAGRLDLAIVSRKIADRRLRFHPLFEDEVVAVLPKTHPFATAEFIPLDAFSSEHMILHVPASESHFLQRHLLPHGIEPKKVSAVRLTETILEFVASGTGVAALAKWAIKYQLSGREVAAIPIGKSGIRRQWYATSVARLRRPAYLDGLISTLRREIQRALDAPTSPNGNKSRSASAIAAEPSASRNTSTTSRVNI